MNTQVTNRPTKSGYAPVNGLNLYYEIHGSSSAGTPLILLHGGIGSVEMFASLIPPLAQDRPVIGLDLQAHGRTADINRPLSFELMGDDIAALIQHLGFARADLLGYSLGGGAALQAAIHHPELVRKLVLISAPMKQAGWYPEVLAGMAALNPEAAQMLIGSPPHTNYMAIAPKPENFPVLIDKLGRLLEQDYDWSADVAALQAPSLIIMGDADSIRPAHAVEMFERLGGGQKDAGWDGSGMPKSQLAILPGTTHFTILNHTNLMLPILFTFLAAPMPKTG